MKKRLLIALGILLILFLGYYITPQFKSNDFEFEPLGTPLNDNKSLNLELINTTKTYQYKIKAVQEKGTLNEFIELTASDQKVLEKRLESFVGNNYEVEAYEEGDQVVFDVRTLQDLNSNYQLLTEVNSEFKVETVTTTETGVSVEGAPADPASQVTEEIDLSRRHFGIAEIKDFSAQAGGELFQVRIPIAIGLPIDKLNLINDNADANLSVTVGGQSYSSSFRDPTAQLSGQQVAFEQTPTHLYISSTLSEDDAKVLRALLNTGEYEFAYRFISEDVLEDDQNYVAFFVFIATVVLLIFALKYILAESKKTFIWQVLYLIFGVLFTLAAYKFFDINVDNGSLILFAVISLLYLFNVKYEVSLIFAIYLILLKVFGLITFIDLAWASLGMLTIFVALLIINGYVYSFIFNQGGGSSRKPKNIIKFLFVSKKKRKGK